MNFQHDCDNCTFLGNTKIEGEISDLYFCPKGADSDLIARFGNEGWEYRSISLNTFLHVLRQGGRVEEWNTIIFGKAVYMGLINIECVKRGGTK
jgi:hypothetical protein